MRTRVRSMVHLARFVGASEWVYLVALGGFGLGLVPAIVRLPRAVSVVLAGTVLVLGTVLVVRDTLALVGRWSAWTMRRRVFPVNFRRPLDVPGLPTIVATEVGRAAICQVLDSELGSAANLITWAERPYSLPPTLASAAPYVVRRSAQGRWPFNGPNVSLATDLTREAITTAADVVMRRGTFYSALCSNELTGWVLSRGEDELDFWGRYLFDGRGGFTALAASELVNDVGVSTLALTTDGGLLLSLQSGKSQTSPGLWAPSGSGALEPQDIAPGGSDRLVDAICRGAERELLEETRIDPSVIAHTQVIGYSRWLDRGGKPEFSCVTALRASSTELGRRGQVHPWLSEERLWTSGRAIIGIADGPDPRFTPPGGVAGERLPCWRSSGLIPDPHLVDDSVSLSLELALDALARQLALVPDLVSSLRARPQDRRTRES